MIKKKSKRRMGGSEGEVITEPQSTPAILSPTDDARSSSYARSFTYHNNGSSYNHLHDYVNDEGNESMGYRSQAADNHDHDSDDDNEKKHRSSTGNTHYDGNNIRKKRRLVFCAVLASAGALLAHRSRVNYVRKTSYDNGYKDGYRKGAEDSLASVGIRGAVHQSGNSQNADMNTQLVGIMNEMVDAYSMRPELILKVIGAANHFFFQSHTVGVLTALLDTRRSHLGVTYDDMTYLANELYTGSFPENSAIGKALRARNLPLNYGTAFSGYKEEGRSYLPSYSAMVKASCLAISYSVNNRCLLNKDSSYSIAKLVQADFLERILGSVDINHLEGIWQWNLVDNSIRRANIIYEALPFFSFDGERSKPLFSGFSYFGNCIIPMLRTSPSVIEHDDFYLSACIDMRNRISSVLEKYSFYQSNNALNKLYGYNTTLEEPSFLGASTLSLDRLLSEKENVDNRNNYSKGDDKESEFNRYFWDKVSFYQLVRSYTITVSIEEKQDDKIIHIVCLPNTRVTGNHTGVATFQENLYSGMSSIFQVAKDLSTGRNYIMGPMRSYCTSEYISFRSIKVFDVADNRDSATKQSYTALYLSMAGQDTKGTGFFFNAHSETVDRDGRKAIINNLPFESGYDPEFYKKWGLSYAYVRYQEEQSEYQDSWYQPLATDSTSVSIKWHSVPFIP